MSKKLSSAWDSVKDIIGKVAPVVGTALGGPFGGIAGSIVAKALGVDTADQAIEALKTNPEALLKLKVAELELKKFMREANIRESELDVQDRASARALAVAKGMTPQVLLSTIYTGGYFGVLLGVMAGDLTIPSGSEGAIFSTIIGVMTAAQVQIMNFWFGSSIGSKEKSAHLASVAG